MWYDCFLQAPRQLTRILHTPAAAQTLLESAARQHAPGAAGIVLQHLLAAEDTDVAATIRSAHCSGALHGCPSVCVQLWQAAREIQLDVDDAALLAIAAVRAAPDNAAAEGAQDSALIYATKSRVPLSANYNMIVSGKPMVTMSNFIIRLYIYRCGICTDLGDILSRYPA